MNSNSILETATIFCDGLDHPEGLAFHRDGTLWAGGEAGQIYQISADGLEVNEVANTGGFILGLAFSPGCDWLAICDLGNKCVWKLEMGTLTLSLLSKGTDSSPLKIPNYPVFNSKGILFVSDSGTFREINGTILSIDDQGETSVWHEGPFNFANGLTLDKDERFLYVVCSFLPGVERIEIEKDGSAGEREVFCTVPKAVPDGLAFTADGVLLISCYAPNCIYLVNQDRQISELVEDWEAHTLANPTNVAFGGAGLNELYCANLGRWHITKLQIGHSGLALPSHQIHH